jgi:prepilin-type N-terminal cleavage/methylation domain-containing protein
MLKQIRTKMAMKMIFKTNTKFKGFTLIELLFVIMLLSILGVAVMQVITQVQAASQTAEQIRNRSEAAARIISEMRVQFSSKGTASLIPLNGGSNPNPTFANSGQNTISYEEDSQGNGKSKILRIITQGTKYANPNIPALYGEVEARYYLKQNENNRSDLIIEFWPALENSNNPSQNTAPTQPIIRQTLSENIGELSFRFRTNTGWVADLTSFFGAAPQLIEVTFSVYGEENDEDFEVFRTALPFGPTVR